MSTSDLFLCVPSSLSPRYTLSSMLYDVYRAKIQRRHLVPGGYIEQAEISVRVCSDIGDIDPDSVWGENNRLFFCAGEASGRTLVIQEKLKGLIEEAGFVDVVEHQYRWPLGAWSQDQKLRDLGRWNQHRWEEGLEGWSMAFCTRIMGVSYPLFSPRGILPSVGRSFTHCAPDYTV